MTAKQSFYENLIRDWKADAATRAEFGDLTAYAAYREREHCRQTGQTLDDIHNETADTTGYIAGLERAGPLTAEALDEIDRLARQWNGAPELRAEFREFSTFAAFMRAKRAGRITTYSNASAAT